MALRSLLSKKAASLGLGFGAPVRHSPCLQTFSLPDLPYDSGALEPAINGGIVQIHHQKYHQASLNNDNEALEQPQEPLHKGDDSTVVGLQSTLKFNGGAAPAYGKLTGSGRNTLKSDVMLFFEGFNLTSDDIKMDYNRIYNPTGVLIRFPSHGALRQAKGLISRKGNLCRLDAIDDGQWQLTESYDGKAVVVQDIPLNATFEEMERLFCGSNFDASNIRVFRRNFPHPCKVAVVRFPSKSEAMHVCRTKNHSFCASGPVRMHVLQ